MSDDEYQALKKDIEEHGQLENIITFENQILDGRHRYIVCQELGIEPNITELDEGVDPRQFVISKNLHRRHLTTEQKAVIAAEMVNTSHGGDRTASGKIAACSQKEAAKAVGVSPKTVQKAVAVKNNNPENFEEMRQGTMKLDAALIQVKQPTKGVPLKKRIKALLNSDKPETLGMLMDVIKKNEGDYSESVSVVDSKSIAWNVLRWTNTGKCVAWCEGRDTDNAVGFVVMGYALKSKGVVDIDSIGFNDRLKSLMLKRRVRTESDMFTEISMAIGLGGTFREAAKSPEWHCGIEENRNVQVPQ